MSFGQIKLVKVTQKKVKRNSPGETKSSAYSPFVRPIFVTKYASLGYLGEFPMQIQSDSQMNRDEARDPPGKPFLEQAFLSSPYKQNNSYLTSHTILLQPPPPLSSSNVASVCGGNLASD